MAGLPITPWGESGEASHRSDRIFWDEKIRSGPEEMLRWPEQKHISALNDVQTRHLRSTISCSQLTKRQAICLTFA